MCTKFNFFFFLAKIIIKSVTQREVVEINHKIYARRGRIVLNIYQKGNGQKLFRLEHLRCVRSLYIFLVNRVKIGQ